MLFLFFWISGPSTLSEKLAFTHCAKICKPDELLETFVNRVSPSESGKLVTVSFVTCDTFLEMFRFVFVTLEQMTQNIATTGRNKEYDYVLKLVAYGSHAGICSYIFINKCGSCGSMPPTNNKGPPLLVGRPANKSPRLRMNIYVCTYVWTTICEFPSVFHPWSGCLFTYRSPGTTPSLPDTMKYQGRWSMLPKWNDEYMMNPFHCARTYMKISLERRAGDFSWWLSGESQANRYIFAYLAHTFPCWNMPQVF